MNPPSRSFGLLYRPAVLVVLALLVGSLMFSALTPPSSADSGPSETLVWGDEFDCKAGSAPDPDRWRHDVGGHGWGNQELQYYTDGAENTYLDGQGNLVIEARPAPAGLSCHYGACQYTSGRLLTMGTFAHAYGRYEARIRIPGGQGLWPAFWMLGDDIATNPWPGSGEIDVMENIGREPGTVWGSLHGPGYSGAQSSNGSFTLPNGRALSEDFHTYAIEWTPERITWYLDDVAYSTKTAEDLNGPWLFDKPHFLLLNLAVGGSWPGSPDATTQFPARMVVDHVRVYDLAPAASPSPTASASVPAAAVAVGSARQIRGYGGKCLDVVEGRAAAGTPLHLWDCYGALASQRWTDYSDGSIRTLGLCMDTVDGATGNGSRLELSTCDGSASQRFTLNGSQDLVSGAAGRCVDVLDWNPSNGARLQLWDCAGSANQKWWASA